MLDLCRWAKDCILVFLNPLVGQQKLVFPPSALEFLWCTESRQNQTIIITLHATKGFYNLIPKYKPTWCKYKCTICLYSREPLYPKSPPLALPRLLECYPVTLQTELQGVGLEIFTQEMERHFWHSSTVADDDTWRDSLLSLLVHTVSKLASSADQTLVLHNQYILSTNQCLIDFSVKGKILQHWDYHHG